MVNKYEVELTATITIEATNAAAAKEALRARRVGGIKVIGECSASASPPSGASPLAWRWRTKIGRHKFSKMKRVR